MLKLKCGILFLQLFTFYLPFQLFGQGYLTKDWGGARTSLNKAGIDFEFVYTGEYFSVHDYDLDEKSTYLDNVDITLALNFEKLLNWKGATLFAYVLGNNGGIPNERVGTSGRYGTIQGISNISAYNTWKLYEFWLEQKFSDKLSLLFGLYDLNSEFDVQEISGIFINPSHGIGVEYSQSGRNGPSIFPTTSLAARIKYTPTDNFYGLLGVFNGVPGDPDNPNGTQIVFHEHNGLLIAYEIGLFENDGNLQEGFGRYSIGGWFYTADFEDLVEVDINGNPVLRNDNSGLYFSAEKFLFSEDDDPTQGLATFLRFGVANSNVNPLDYYWGLGFRITGLINGRDKDIIGLAIGTAHAGKKYIEVNNNAGLPINVNETIIELTYSLQATDWLRLQPDYQYVINPMGTHLHQKANVLGIRFEIIL